MSSFDGDSKLQNIKDKVDNNIELKEQDIMTLSFIPLMNSEKSKRRYGEIINCNICIKN